MTSFSDLLNYDIKIPGEHTIKGESFDAEIQMLHMHPEDRRVSSIGVLVRARDGGFNWRFQEILDEFQQVYDQHAFECANPGVEYVPPERPSPQGRFYPYADELMPTIFFYRYDGSITEPPCKDITWYVVIQGMDCPVQTVL